MEAGIFLEFSPPTFEIVAPSLSLRGNLMDEDIAKDSFVVLGVIYEHGKCIEYVILF